MEIAYSPEDARDIILRNKLAVVWDSKSASSAITLTDSPQSQTNSFYSPGAGLLVRSLASVLQVDPGFLAGGVLTVEMHSAAGNDPTDPPRFQQLAGSLEAMPGVEAAGGISQYFQTNPMREEIVVAGRRVQDSSQAAVVNYDVIAGHYLQALGIPLLRGRYFAAQDGPDATRVAIVNKAFVRAFLTGEDPIWEGFPAWLRRDGLRNRRTDWRYTPTGSHQRCHT